MFRQILLSIFIILLFTSCGTDKITREEGKVYISGYVLADYPIDNGQVLNSPLYTVNSKRSAQVTFTHENEEILYSVFTDDLSEFSININPGVYDVIIETPHSFPDYIYDVEVTTDTFLTLNINYDFIVIDTLVVDFYYGTTEFPPIIIFNEEFERLQLSALNDQIGNRLNLQKMVRNSSDDIFTNYVYSSYRIPLVEGVYTYDAFSRAQMLLRPGLDLFPKQMTVGYQTFFIPIDFHNGGIDIVLDPDDFVFEYEWENYNDSNSNFIYLPPEMPLDTIYWP